MVRTIHQPPLFSHAVVLVVVIFLFSLFFFDDHSCRRSFAALNVDGARSMLKNDMLSLTFNGVDSKFWINLHLPLLLLMMMFFVAGIQVQSFTFQCISRETSRWMSVDPSTISKQISRKVLREAKSVPVLCFFCISRCDVTCDMFPFPPCSNLANFSWPGWLGQNKTAPR